MPFFVKAIFGGISEKIGEKNTKYEVGCKNSQLLTLNF
jgi:hypothetical protein